MDNEELVGMEKLIAENPSKIITALSQQDPPNTSYIVCKVDDAGTVEQFLGIVPYFRFANLQNL